MWQIKKTVVILFAVFFAFQLMVGSAAAATIYVDDDGTGNYTTIQAAVNNASSGDQIIVKPGTYNEYIEVDMSELTIISESGNPDDTIVQATDNLYVFNVLASGVSIKGFNIRGDGDSTAVYINYGLGNCHIENNKISNFISGVDVFLFSTGNTIENNEISSCSDGIILSECSSNTLSNNKISDCKSGVFLGIDSSSNTLSSNEILNCEHGVRLLGCTSNSLEKNLIMENEYGIFIEDESHDNTLTENVVKANKKAGLQVTGLTENAVSNNQIYNNYFSNKKNVDSNKQANVWNTTQSSAKSIIHGPYLGGNYWATPAGDGFSQTHSDADGDGIAEEPYYVDEVNIDYLPLATASENPSAVLPVANFETSITQGPAPLSVEFTDSSQYAAERNWDFESDGIIDSIDVSPTHMYTAVGTYTAKLTAVNENGTDSKLATITVTQTSVDDSDTGDSGNGEEDSGDSGGSSDGDSGSSNDGGSSQSSSGVSSGGAVGSPEPAVNVKVKEIKQEIVTSGKKVKFDFTKNATCVVYVSFDAKKTFGKTTAIAELLKGKSVLVPELPSGEVYKSFNIWVGNGGFANSQNIENPVVCFKVEKAWVKNENIDPDSITLNRYNESEIKWDQLLTSLLNEDDKFLYFTADVPRFSSFVITGETLDTLENITKIDMESGISSLKRDSAKDIGFKISQNKDGQKAPGFETLYGIVCVFAFYLYKKR
jgi:PGF-pre-PGF domain-containing protein